MRTTLQTDPVADDIEFSRVLDGYRRELEIHCVRITRSASESEDLVQETLVRAWRGRGRFEGREGPASLRAWLRRIATNVCHDALLRSRSRPQSARPAEQYGEGGDWLEWFASAEPGPEEEVSAREGFENLIEAALALPERQRTALILRDVIGLTARESATLLGTSVPTVTSALQRARENLRARRDQEGAAWAGSAE